MTQSFLDLADNLKIIHDSNPALAGLLGRRAGLDPALYDAAIQGSAKLAGNLKDVAAWTQADADKAGDLDRKWNGLLLTAERWGQKKVLELAPELEKTLSTDAQDIQSIKQLWSWLTTPIGMSSANASTTPADGTKILADAMRANSGGASPSASAYREAIAAVESASSGGYAAVGQVTRSGDRAYGRYQIMGNNIPAWSKAALGREMSVADFMNSPHAQDAIFDHRFGGYVSKYGNAQDAASAWLTGRPLAQGANSRDLYGTSGAEYVRRFNANLGPGVPGYAPGIAADARGGSSSTVSHETNINGPINVYPPAGADGTKIANDFRAAILKRQADASNANGGQQ